MANHKSAKKRAKRNAERGKRNSARTSAIRTSLKKAELAIQGKELKVAQEALKTIRPILAKGVAKGVITKGAAARKISRLSARVKALKK